MDKFVTRNFSKFLRKMQYLPAGTALHSGLCEIEGQWFAYLEAGPWMVMLDAARAIQVAEALDHSREGPASTAKILRGLAAEVQKIQGHPLAGMDPAGYA